MNTPVKSIPEELLVLEVLSRSSSNRSRILSANISDLVLAWLKSQLQSFPDDEEMLSFGESSEENRDDEWMRSTSLLLTIIDHFNAVFLPITPQRGLEGMQRAEASSNCSLLCGVELTRLLVKCKEKKEDAWTAMTRWLKREIMLCFFHESSERQTTMEESLAAAGEEVWLRRISGDLASDASESLPEAVDRDLLVFLLLQPTVSDQVAEL